MSLLSLEFDPSSGNSTTYSGAGAFSRMEFFIKENIFSPWVMGTLRMEQNDIYPNLNYGDPVTFTFDNNLVIKMGLIGKKLPKSYQDTPEGVSEFYLINYKYFKDQEKPISKAYSSLGDMSFIKWGPTIALDNYYTGTPQAYIYRNNKTTASFISDVLMKQVPFKSPGKDIFIYDDLSLGGLRGIDINAIKTANPSYAFIMPNSNDAQTLTQNFPNSYNLQFVNYEDFGDSMTFSLVELVGNNGLDLTSVTSTTSNPIIHKFSDLSIQPFLQAKLDSESRQRIKSSSVDAILYQGNQLENIKIGDCVYFSPNYSNKQAYALIGREIHLKNDFYGTTFARVTIADLSLV